MPRTKDDGLAAKLRPGNVHSAEGWEQRPQSIIVAAFFLRGRRWSFNIAITRVKIHFLYRDISRSAMAHLVFRRLVTRIVRI